MATGVGALDDALLLDAATGVLASPPLRHARKAIAPTITTTMIPKLRTLRTR
jgi:hypothetical protein